MKTLLLLLTALVCFAQAAIIQCATAADVYVFHDETGARYYTNAPCQNCVKAFLPLAGKKGDSARRLVAKDRPAPDYESLIVAAGSAHAVDPDLVRAIIRVESNFNSRAVSPKGAVGLMQLMPQTARELGVSDPFEPAGNIRGGVMYLRRLLDRLENNLPLSLAAYNAGLERVLEKNDIPAFPETRNYVRQVMAHYGEAKGL